jgi:signal transduction histidine kinase/CheY-like chemotaxis protein/CHASE3 domain sensor protein
MSNQRNSAPSIIKQLQVVFAISLSILLVASFASFLSNRNLIESSQLVNHTNEVIVNAESLISEVKDAETGQRGYILTNDPAFLQPYNASYEQANKILDHLKEMTVDNPVQQKNLAKAKELIDRRYVQLEKVLNSVSNTSVADRIVSLRQEHEAMNEGRRTMRSLREVVDDIKNEENRLLKMRMQQQETYIKYTPVLLLVALVVSLLISVVAYMRIKSDLDERARKQKEDEQNLLETKRRISLIEDMTQKVASGNMGARSRDDIDDELGRISVALNNMADKLEQNFAEMEEHSWLQAGSIEIGNSVRGERFVKSVAHKVLSAMAAYLGADVGTLYVISKDGSFNLQGGYAVEGVKDNIPAGEGLIGQAALRQQLMVVEDLPPDYLNVSSSLGRSAPVYLLLLPLIYNGDTIGIIELGKRERPLPRELEFLENNVNAISISLNTAINYEKIQDLLEETQAQSEELQAQHNELENINAELEAQTEKLQASEEELKVQQEELLQANTELEERSRLLEEKNQEILEKNAEVQRKAEELELSTRYKSEFLANMSHELRTPLNSILLLGRLLAENNDNNLSNDQVEYAKVILSSGNGLLALIDEILDLSKIEAGKMLLEYEIVSTDEILNDMRGLFDPVAKDKSIDLNITKGADVPATIESDKQRLEQVLKNLLSNALKFTQQGSVTLNIGTRSGDRLAFSVKDTGIGIPTDKQHHIFEAFQQADGSTRRKYGGTGLGLSISKELARLLGGDIELESTPGSGSCFTVVIPVSRAASARTDMESYDMGVMEVNMENTSRSEQPKKRSEFISDTIPDDIPDDRTEIRGEDKSILIVEDDVNFARSLLDLTRQRGYKGIVTVRGDEVLGLAKQYLPSGILLDIQLPVKSGWEVMEELKKESSVRHIPVHMMSAHHVKNESLIRGAVDFMNKPVAFEKMQEIFSRIEEVSNKKTKKVLIIEENSKHAQALSYFLSSHNVNSEIKNNISDTVDAIKQNVDCVILDMQVPGQSAYDTLENIKKTNDLENLPVIVFTGKSLSMAEEQRIKYYADSIVVKTAHSYQRVLDEVSLFLHLVEESKAKAANGSAAKKLGALKDVLNGKTVLVVDDDVRNIFSLTKALEKYDMQIVTAIDGKEALNMLHDNRKVDIVLLDMMMPEMDGYETAAEIRKNRAWKDLPVIAVTAKAMMGDRERCINAGASDYITKPVDIDQLLSLLRVWLYNKA